MKVFFVELLLTKYCNQSCSYCNVFPMTKYNKEPEVDLDFLKEVLDSFETNNLFIELCGGEPGCVTNLDDVYKTVKNHKNVKYIQIMSNGLVRKKRYPWLNDKILYYNEHLIKTIKDKKIIKFYKDMDFVPELNRKFVVVTTKEIINSLIKNFKYYKLMGMFDKRFWYKIMVDKSSTIDLFHEELEAFLKKIEHLDIRMLEYFKNPNDNMAQKKMCAMNPPNVGIDFETKEIIHCCAFLDKSKRYPFTKENCQKVLYNQLFEIQDYCKNCYVFDDSKNKVKCMLQTKKGVPTNRSYWYDKF